MILLHSQYDVFGLGNFSDRVKRHWREDNVYIDYPAPDSPTFATDPRSLGPKRWRLKESKAIVAELTGWIDPVHKRGQHSTWEIAWMAETLEEVMAAETPIPRVNELSQGFIGDGPEARKVKPQIKPPIDLPIAANRPQKLAVTTG